MSDEKQRGIAIACYVGGPSTNYYLPYMECLCGFSTGRCNTWQGAGELLDEHLKATKESKDGN